MKVKERWRKIKRWKEIERQKEKGKDRTKRLKAIEREIKRKGKREERNGKWMTVKERQREIIGYWKEIQKDRQKGKER